MGFFRDVRAAQPQDVELVSAGEIRKFRAPETVGRLGTQELQVPGLLEVKYVRLGTVTLPPTFVHTFQVMPAVNPPNLRSEVLSNYQLDHLDDGTPVLLRNKMSNFGVWQEGVDIYVGGVWAADVKPTDPAVTPSGEAVVTLTAEELLQRQADLDAEAAAKAAAEAEAIVAAAKAKGKAEGK